MNTTDQIAKALKARFPEWQWRSVSVFGEGGQVHAFCYFRGLTDEYIQITADSNEELLSAVRSLPLPQPTTVEADEDAPDSLRVDYPLRCDQCNRAHILDCSIPSDIWNQIAPDGGMLCPVCMNKRMRERGLNCEAEFYYAGTNLVGRSYKPDTGTIDWLARAAKEFSDAASQYASHVSTLTAERDRLRRRHDIDLQAARTLRPEANSVGDMAVVVGAKISSLAAERDQLAEVLTELVNSPNAKQNEMWDRARAALTPPEPTKG